MIENKIDYINTVKIQGEGYLVNDTMSVPKADGNRHMKDVKVWLESNTPEPEFTVEEIAIQEQDTINSEARQYLASTDWYITRQFESGVEVPKDILEKRKEARLKVVD